MVESENSAVNSTSKQKLKLLDFNDSFDEYEFGMDTRVLMKDYLKLVSHMEQKLLSSVPKHHLVTNSNFY